MKRKVHRESTAKAKFVAHIFVPTSSAKKEDMTLNVETHNHSQ